MVPPWRGRQGLAQGGVERAHTHGQYRAERLKRFPKPLVVTSLFFTSLQGSDFRLAVPGDEVVSLSVLPGLCQPLAPSSSLHTGRLRLPKGAEDPLESPSVARRLYKEGESLHEPRVNHHDPALDTFLFFNLFSFKL